MEYFFTLDWSNFILHDAVRIFCRENTVVFLRRGIGISSGWSSSLFTRPLCGSKNPKRSKAVPREREDRRARCERRWNLYSASSWPSPGNFFSTSTSSNPRGLHLSAFLPQTSTMVLSSSRLARATAGYTERWTNNNKYIFPGRVANPVRGGTSMRARTGIA